MIEVGTFDFDILSDMFITGADQLKPELRVPEIRGGLRWWFRVLGGFKSDARPVRDQEDEIFGSVHGDCKRSKLILRAIENKLISDSKEVNDYFLFPLKNNRRGYFKPSEKAFSLQVLWNGEESQCKNLKALITIFGNLGSLGMRTRRCYGAIAFSENKAPMPLKDAFDFFKTPNAIEIKAYNDSLKDVNSSISKAMAWLNGWRSVGQGKNRNTGPGMKYGEDIRSYAWRDHEIGRGKCELPAVRPALGMPLLQKYGAELSPKNKELERFASPVILRPFKDMDGSIKLLTIFVEKYKWDEKEKIKIKSLAKEHEVSLELYDAMKNNAKLKEFTP